MYDRKIQEHARQLTNSLIDPTERERFLSEVNDVMYLTQVHGCMQEIYMQNFGNAEEMIKLLPIGWDMQKRIDTLKRGETLGKKLDLCS